MNNTNILKKMALCSATTALLALSQNSFAHTRLQTPTIDEGTRVYNNEVIGHGCEGPTGSKTIGGADTIGTVVVFPDGADSIVTVNGEASESVMTDFISGFGIGKVRSKDIFSAEAVITDANSNVTGYWTGGGDVLTAGLVGLVPFRTNAVTFNEDSCAKSVTLKVAIADVCQITDINGFNNSTVMLWTPAVGSNFDGLGLDGENSPATLTINRNLDTNPLPSNCAVVDGDGDGIDEGDTAGDIVEITPSAAQLNRDMPVKIDGVQIWPAL